MILLISTCKEKLHELEFVRPIEQFLNSLRIKHKTKSYLSILPRDIENSDKIIICGTSLKDNDFLNHLSNFKWIKTIKKPVLGICAGMQIIGLVFGIEIDKKTEIGFYPEEFKNDFLGIKGKKMIWHLHNSYIDFSKSLEFYIFSSSEKVSQAIKHKDKEIYGVLFHPEVRNLEIIGEFCISFY